MDAERQGPRIELEFAGIEGLQAELESNLGEGRAFVAGAQGVSERDGATLVLVHPDDGRELELAAEVVWVKSEEPGRGVGFQLQGFDEGLREALHAFAEAPKRADSPDATNAPRAHNVMQKVRGYSGAEPIKAAREAGQSERVALERVFGKTVWEALLQNPRISLPEVARIARKGSIPKPLIAVLTGNPAWVSSPEIRRALLSNPRLQGQALEKVLGAMSRAELGLAANQAGYPMAVRQAAKKRHARFSGS